MVDSQLQRKLQYAGSVESIYLNETHVAALVDGKVHLQLVSSLIKYRPHHIVQWNKLNILLLDRRYFVSEWWRKQSDG